MKEFSKYHEYVYIVKVWKNDNKNNLLHYKSVKEW